MASNNPGLKRTESIADTMPEALKKSRYHMKRCFAKYIEKGRRTLKLHQLMDETAEAIDDVTERNQVLEGLLGYILCSTQAIGHGISNSLLDKIREVSIDFFSLPMEEKQKYARAVNEAEGYGSDRIVSDKQVHDWSHRLSLKVFPQRKRRLNLWPQIPQDFRKTLDEYAMKIKIVTEVLFKAIAKSLNLEENG
ncbi:hypothetical protein LWI28_020830 [Acer negundo]|uniref:Sucrose synthase N-terminal domain-containing protein n=1 Tax=Acer negundo TaxID=4023 RepID=A0AAD5P018_ACENE|nr:hypothetical protein LWI28_020830 [Acer negundo]